VRPGSNHSRSAGTAALRAERLLLTANGFSDSQKPLETLMSIVREAHAKINEFEKRSTGTDWLKIKKDHLVRGMRVRLENPNLISTRLVDLCGPAAFFRCLAEDDPVMYVKAIISLYETNSAWIGSRRFTAGQSLRMAAPPPPSLPFNPRSGQLASGMDQVDWVPLASLKDHESTIANYNHAGGDFPGLTKPAGIEKWFRSAGYAAVTNDTNILCTKNLDHIKKAGSLHSLGYRICLRIDESMLKVASQNNLSIQPDRWVVLMSGVSLEGESRVRLRVHSDGTVMSVPEQGEVSTKTLLKNYYGFVAARPRC
jgi:hypothetical protein